MLRKTIHKDNLKKKEEMRISQIEYDNISKPPKPFKIMIHINNKKKDKDVSDKIIKIPFINAKKQ
jgi:hypothetical protein